MLISKSHLTWMVALSVIFLGGCATRSKENLATAPYISSGAQQEILSNYRISRTPDMFASGAQIYLAKNSQGWNVSQNRDLSTDDAELLIINPDTKSITLGARIGGDWRAKDYWQLCTKSLVLKDPNPSIRSKTAYDFCKSNFATRTTDAGTLIGTAIAAPFGAVIGTASGSYEVDAAQISSALSSANQVALANALESYRLEKMRATEFNAQQAKERAEKYERDRPAREKAERERLLQIQKENAIALAQVKAVGQKICRTINAQSGPYGQYKFNVLTTAFTEGVNGNKIQLRIAGLQRTDVSSNNGNNMSEISGDVVYKPNSVIWEDASLWKPCR